MFGWIHSHIISLLMLAPALCAVLLPFIKDTKSFRWLALCSSIFSFLCACHIWCYFDNSSSNLQFVESYEWIPDFGIKYIVGIDGLNILLIMLTAFLTPLILISMWDSTKNERKITALFLALETGVFGALVSFDFLSFYVFWEAMLIPMYFIIGIWGGKNRIYATTKFILYTALGSVFMLVAAIYLYFLHYKLTGIFSTNLMDLYQLKEIPLEDQIWLFLAFTIAFAIKVPLWPFHTWLPHAHTEAPTAGSVILAGILLKMGTYGFLRFSVPLFPQAFEAMTPMLLTLSLIGVIYGSVCAWMQDDAKKLVAYSSVAHLGFVMLGCLAFANSQMSEQALNGAMYQMICHGLTTGCLFFLIGVLYERKHSRLFSDYGGLAASMPKFSVLLVMATLGAIGLPGTGGFVGEFLILIGLFQSNPVAAAIALLGVILGAVYMLHFVRKLIFGPISEENKHLKDLTQKEMSYLVPLVVLILITGLFPSICLNKSSASLAHLGKHYNGYKLLVEDSVETLQKASNFLSQNKPN